MKSKLQKTMAIALGSAILAAMGLSGCTEDQQAKVSQKGTPAEYSKVWLRGQTEDTMPIGSYIGPTDQYYGNGYKLDSLITEEIFKKIADCGVNYVIDTKNQLTSANGEAVLTFAEQFGISYLIKEDSLISMDNKKTSESVHLADAKTIADKLKTYTEKYSYFSGLYAKDEPTSNLYAAIQDSWEIFSQARTDMDESELTLYYNLFPPVGGAQLSYNTDSGLSYDEYLQGFIETGADYLMFDSYPFLEGTDKISGSWFNLLDKIAKKADSVNIPWWGFIQCGGHYGDSPNGHRLVNENEMNWNVNTMLCFGSKGIAYFPGVWPPEWATTDEATIYDHSLINQYGDKTAYWYYAQKINKQIEAIDEVLMNSAQQGVIFHGDGPDGCIYGSTLSSYRVLKKVSGDDALVGCFDYKGGVALYVMNNSITEHRGEIKLSFDDTYEYEVIQRGVSDSLVAKEFVVTLEAGEGALIVVK